MRGMVRIARLMPDVYSVTFVPHGKKGIARSEGCYSREELSGALTKKGIPHPLIQTALDELQIRSSAAILDVSLDS